MKKFQLNVYDKDGKNIVKTLEGSEINLGFGTVRKLMKLLKIDNTTNSLELLATINGAWEELISILDRVFVDATEEDWDNVQLNELIPVLVQIVKYSLTKALSIPTEKN